MKKRNIGNEILESLKNIKSGKGRKFKVNISSEIKNIREDLEISQNLFANLLGVSVRTLQAWEQGKRNPSGAALSLLKIAQAKPEVIRTVLVS
jgi:putative transcriptional regulator